MLYARNSWCDPSRWLSSFPIDVKPNLFRVPGAWPDQQVSDSSARVPAEHPIRIRQPRAQLGRLALGRFGQIHFAKDQRHERMAVGVFLLADESREPRVG